MRATNYLNTLILLKLMVVEGFVTNQPHPLFQQSKLFAKKARTTHRGSSGGGGFGGSRTQKVVDEYAVFPKLESNILQTLIPSSTTDSFTGEIYQRLDQIYGFPDFNYESNASLSLQDLIASPSSLESLLRNPDNPSMATGSSRSSEDPNLSLNRIPAFTNLNVLHIDPLVVSVKDFFTAEECDRYIEMSTSKTAMQSRSPTVGKDAAAKAQRTSTTWYHPFRNVPELMAKASRLLGLDSIDCWEEPQTVRYRRNEKFTWHLDALGPAENQAHMGGQRIATLLVYLTDLGEGEGGATLFRDLEDANGRMLRVRPEKGSALLFFPAAGGIPDAPFDIRTLHCGEVVSETAGNDKWISQLWLREQPYKPTAPPGNLHAHATTEIDNYCNSFK